MPVVVLSFFTAWVLVEMETWCPGTSRCWRGAQEQTGWDLSDQTGERFRGRSRQ